jgi:Domain of unknown function (DUF3850)
MSSKEDEMQTHIVSNPTPSPHARPRMEHKVKSWPSFFDATLAGVKTHDVRRIGDRDYQVGDTLRLQEFDPEKQHYTGRELCARITYITSAKLPCALSEACLHPDYCILSITKC